MRLNKIKTEIANRDYLKDALSHRSARRELVVDCIFKFCKSFSHFSANKTNILQAIEYFHTSASIIDDIQDGDVKRKDSPSYYKRQGYDNAAFASLNFWTYALEVLVKSYNIQPVLNILRKLINSQEADVGLYRRNSENIFENYNSTSALKLSYELELILFLCYPFPKDVLYSKVLSILSEIGKLIQYIDDKNDEFDNFSTLIHNKEEYFSLRQSLPIVLSIELENMPIEYLFKKISKNEALYIHKNFSFT